MRNDKVICVIQGYTVLPARKPGYVFLRSPQGANFSLPITVLYELVGRLENEPGFRGNFGC